jgi:hypothetical protein
MATTAIARRNTALAKAQTALGTMRKKLTSVRAEQKASVMPSAVLGGACVLAGSATTGALRHYAGDEVMGVPVGLGAGLLLLGAGSWAGDPRMVLAAAGLMAPDLAEWTEDTIADWTATAIDAPADSETVAPPADNVVAFETGV